MAASVRLHAPMAPVTRLRVNNTAPRTAPRRVALRVHAFSAIELSSGFSTRPYTIRTGDSLYQVAKKRNITVNQIKALNPSLTLDTQDYLIPGETILLPAGKLSQRDTEILAGIGSGSTRIYPVRSGETIETVAENRNIPVDMLKSLNPELDLQSLKGGEKILLPTGYYTKREREMLSTVMPEAALTTPSMATTGSQVVPAALFAVLAVVGAVCYKSKRFQGGRKEQGQSDADNV